MYSSRERYATEYTYYRGSIFVNNAYSYVYLKNQVSLFASNCIKGKQKYDLEAQSAEMPVQ